MMESIKKKNKGGRKPTPYPEGWEHVYNEWQSGEFSSVEACRILRLPKGTFYNMAKRYERQNNLVSVRHSTARKASYKGQERVASVTGRYADLVRKYSDYIERNILPFIDYQKLQSSYQTQDMEYAKGIFNLLHQAMQKIYGSDIFADSKDYSGNAVELILLPGGVAGPEGICLALMMSDLKGTVSSIELLTEFGCCSLSSTNNMLPIGMKKIKEVAQRYTPYICGYAISFPLNDFKMNTLPEKLQELLNNFRENKVRLLCSRKN
jgi:hypothetical protein